MLLVSVKIVPIFTVEQLSIKKKNFIWQGKNQKCM